MLYCTPDSPAHYENFPIRIQCENLNSSNLNQLLKFIFRNIVDAAGMRDLAEASVYEQYALPKMYYKVYYSVSAAIHLRCVSF